MCSHSRKALVLARWRVGLLALALLALASCKREEKASPPPGPPPTLPMPTLGGPDKPGFPPFPKTALLDESEPHAAGKKVYNSSGCARCHSMGGAGPTLGGVPALPGKGPDLAKVAAKPGRDAAWFISYVSDPRKVKADSMMPPFDMKVGAADMRALGDFLVSLK